MSGIYLSSNDGRVLLDQLQGIRAPAPAPVTVITGLPKTGQLTSYVDYDDGYYQKGSPILPRFIDNGDNTVTDRITNLTWIQRPELIIPDGLNATNIGVEKGDYIQGGVYAAGDIVTDPSDSSAWGCLLPNTTVEADFATERTNYSANWSISASIWATSNGSSGVNPTTMVWSNNEGTPSAINSCAGDGTSPYKGLIKSGKSDWRLPNRFELESILNLATVYPAIDGAFFPNCQSDYYWSATTFVGNYTFAWIVYFVDGYVGSVYKNLTYYVRPVRSSQ